MKICKIIIKDFHQFKDFELDLTHPETGEPLEKVCFIGSNGTGKTKLLDLLGASLGFAVKWKAFTCIKITYKNKSYWIAVKDSVRYIFDGSISEENEWLQKIEKGIFPRDTLIYKSSELDSSIESFSVIDSETKNSLIGDVVIFTPAESHSSDMYQQIDAPTVNDALNLLKDFPSNHLVSNETITDFWKTLIYHLKKRDNDFLEFQNLEENQNRTVREVREEFDSKHPKILDSLAKLWDEILGKAGLEFDAAGASNPIQLTDNLKAYIKLKSTGERINYNDLSTGIRNFIFKVGHIYSLYFNRNVESGFLLVDEPENSLFPDFLYDLVDIYLRITHNTQVFMATHNPIIAAQFEPYERFILEFDDQGHVQARRGTVPVGDDPNDILSKDFGVRSLLGKEGVKKWERYIELRTLIKLTEDREEKSRLLDEFMRIGNEYNFANAVS